MDKVPVRQHLALIGGGHAHLQVLRRLAMQPLRGLQITLISREVYTVYSGMLPGYVAGHYSWDDVHIDLAPICAVAQVNLIQGEVQELDIPKRKIKIPGRADLQFDLLSINVGSAASSIAMGEHQEGISVKPVSLFLPELETLLAHARHQGEIDITIAGAGAAGVELALALEYRLQGEQAIASHRVRLVTAADSCLPDYNEQTRKKAVAMLERAGLQVMTGFDIVRAEAGVLHSKDGRTLKAANLLWATTAAPHPWFRESGLPVDLQGFVLVDEHLACIGIPRIFAVGDAASMLHFSVPRAGVFAVRQGRVLQQNIYHKLLGTPLKKFKPQQEFLSLISLGERQAIATRGRWHWQGRLPWRWKNWIDRRFMRKFRVDGGQQMRTLTEGKLPIVLEYDDQKSPPSDVMYCGGCAAKLGSELLTHALDRLGLLTPDVTGAGDDAAITRFDSKVSIVQSLDGFRALLPDAWLAGRITANHVLNDIYAMGADPTSAMAWVTVPRMRPELMEDTLFQVLSGALATFEETGVLLIGGHSGEGAELSIGFAVTGIVDEQPWYKGGLRVGDDLILTGAIGAGVLFAAQMRGLCRGAWLFNAIGRLLQSNSRARALLRHYDIAGCTDISGFGLLGHALEMARASRCELQIQANNVPVLEGALDCFTRGVQSTLQDANEQVFRHVRLIEARRGDARVRILVDPMTAGGLLFGLPEAQAPDCLERLRAAGYQAALIGKVVAAEDRGGRIQLFG